MVFAACSSTPGPTGTVVTPLPEGSALSLGLTTDYVVWARGQGTPESLWVAPKSGGSPQMIQAFDSPTSGVLPRVPIATTPDAVYAVSAGTLFAWKPGDASASAVGTGFDGAQALAVCGSSVAYVAGDTGTAGHVGVYSLSAPVGHRMLTSGATLGAFMDRAFCDGSSLYWVGLDSNIAGASNAGELFRTSLSDGTTDDISHGGVSSFTMGGGWVGWITGGMIQLPTDIIGEIRGQTIGASATVDVALDADASDLASDGAEVYVVESGATGQGTGKIVAFSTVGGAPTVLGQHEQVPALVAIDDTDVYWVDVGLYHYASDGDTLVYDGGAAILRTAR